jgi:hypothetical protein
MNVGGVVAYASRKTIGRVGFQSRNSEGQSLLNFLTTFNVSNLEESVNGVRSELNRSYIVSHDVVKGIGRAPVDGAVRESGLRERKVCHRSEREELKSMFHTSFLLTLTLPLSMGPCPQFRGG